MTRLGKYIFLFTAFSLLYVAVSTAKAEDTVTSDLYNRYFDKKSISTGLPIGYHKEYITSNSLNGPFNTIITHKVGTSGFRVQYVTYTSCNPTKRVKCRDIPVVKLKKVTNDFNGYGFLALNPSKLQEVIPGTIRRFYDITNCNTIMPVIIKYYDINKNLMKVNSVKGPSYVQEFNQFTEANNKWRYHTFRHGIPANVYYIHISRAITNSTSINGSCLIRETHDILSK